MLRNPRHEAVAQALFAGQKPEQASEAAGYDVKASSFAPNARKRAQRADIRARVEQLRAGYVAKDVAAAGVSLDYMLTRLRDDLEFNVDDYLAPVKRGQRRFAIGETPRKILGRLSELTIEPGRFGVKTKVKGHDPIALMRLAAELQGFIRSKTELTGRDGGPIETAAVMASENELFRRIAFAMAEGLRRKTQAAA